MAMEKCDVLVIGAGCAGMRAAYEAKSCCPELDVLVVSSGHIGNDGSSNLMASEALGINAPLNYMNDGDCADDFYNDIVTTGGGLQDDHLCRIIADESSDRIKELIEMGVKFSSDENGIVQQKLSGCTKKRSLTCGGTTGRNIVNALRNYASKAGVRELERIRILKLSRSDDGRVNGAIGVSDKGQKIVINSKAIVLATGGAGKIFSRNVNTSTQMGDGWAIAYDIGCTFTNMEFFQIGPAVVNPKMKFIIHSHMWRLSPILRNNKGEEFLKKYCKNNVAVEKALSLKAMSYPFSVRTDAKYVDIAIFNEVMSGRGSENGGVYFDVTSVSKDELENKAPITYETILKAGADLSKDIIEIGLVVQNFNGGVLIDENGSTGVEGLYACGEVTGGVHGADRPGGNNLTDTQVFGYRAGRAAAKYALEHEMEAVKKDSAEFRLRVTEKEKEIIKESEELFYRNLTIIRNEKGLNEVEAFIKKNNRKDICLQLKNRLLVASLLVAAEKERKESRGTHYREDFPETRDEYCRRIIIKKSEDETPVIV